jgi:L-threonylcarbamoyladenylate synthase
MSLVLKVDTTQPEDKPMVLASEVVQAGGVIVYPTETLYGIGANAWDGTAIAKVRAIKRREGQKPILVVIKDEDQLASLTNQITDEARLLISQFWPGPLTLVFKATKQVPDLLSQGHGTIGVRIPSSPFCLRLLSLCGCPLTSTSANLSGGPTLHSVVDIKRAIPRGVDLFLDAGELKPRLPSTVLDVTVSPPRILRCGAVSSEDIQRVVPTIVKEGAPD